MENVVESSTMNWRKAIAEDNIEALKLILDDVDIVDEYSTRTPLRQAAFGNKMACVKWLIDQGALINDVNSEGWSALHLAIWRDNAQVVKMLLNAGASTTSRISSDHSPLALCFLRDARGCARVLLDRGVTHDGLLLNTPKWVENFLDSRKRCRHAALLVVGIHRWRRSSVMAGNGRDVVRIVAQHLWALRLVE